MAYQTPESLARILLGLYEDHYQTHIDEVTAAWATADVDASREIVPFTDFEFRVITADPLAHAVTQFNPALAISVGNQAQVLDEGWRIQMFDSWYDLDMNVFYFIRGIDEQELATLLMRHEEATMRFFKAHPRLDCGKNVYTNDFRLEPSANVYRSGGNSLVKGLRTRFTIRYIQRA